MSKQRLMEYALMPPYLHQLSSVQRAIKKDTSVESRLERIEAMIRDLGETLGSFAKMVGGHQRRQQLMMDNKEKQGLKAERSKLAGPGSVSMGGQGGAGGAGGAGGMMMMGPDGMMMMPMMDPGYGMMDPYGMGMYGMPMMDPNTGLALSAQEQANIMALQAQRLRDSETQLPAILRQIDRLQRTINNQEMRMEGMVVVLRDIELMLRNQQPVIITQEARGQRKPVSGLSEADLEKEVKRLLGKDPSSGFRL